MEETQLVTEFIKAINKNGIEAQRLERSAVRETLADLAEGETVASRIPYDGVKLPGTVAISSDFERIREATTGITPVRLGIASHGSIVLQLTPEKEGQVSLWPPRHIAILRIADVVPDLRTALKFLSANQNNEKSFVIISGPSATGDMGERVTGVHGPDEIEVLLVE